MTSPRALLLGRHVAVDSFLTRLDPRTKLLCAAVTLGSLLASVRPIDLVPAALLFVLALAASRLPPRAVFSRGRGLAWLLLVTFLAQLFLLPASGPPVGEIGPIVLFRDNVERAAAVSLSLLITLLVAALVTMSTSPVEVADAMRQSFGPLSRVGVPVEDLALVSMIALRSAPALLDEAERIRKAQLARGLRPARGPAGRARALLPLLVPLVEGVFRRSDELAVALEARGYEPGATRTSYRALVFGSRDAVALVAALAACGATLLLAARR